MERKDKLNELDLLLKSCHGCKEMKKPYTPRSHEKRNSYCIKKCKTIGRQLYALGIELEKMTKEERKKRGISA